MLNVEFDFSELRRNIRRTRHELTRAVDRAVERGAAEGAAEARAVGQFKDRTTDLRGSIKDQPGRRGAGSAEAWIVATAKHASFVEGGTDPHVIRPKAGHGFIGPLLPGQSRRARTDIGTHRIALRWYVGGQPVFARLVHHPGGRPYPFMGPGVLKAERVIIREVESGFVTVAALWN